MRLRTLSFLLFVISPNIARAENRAVSFRPNTPQALQKRVTNTSGPIWTGALELRPSFNTGTSQIYGQDYMELGVKLNADTYLGYQQQFSNNFQDTNPKLEDGAQLALSDGFFRARFGNILKNRGSSLLLEPRVYLPTDDSLRSEGMKTRLRLNTVFEKQVSNFYSLFLIEAPILHIYDRSGTLDYDSGLPAANPAYENRFIINQQFTFSKSVALSIPLLLQSIQYANYKTEAQNNNELIHTVILWPEITYTVSKNLSLGLAYQTGNLMSRDLSQIQINSGFASGNTELVLHLGF